MTNSLSLRCLLFVPGNRPERYIKALASGVDAVCVDLEDAVGPEQKDQARASALAGLAEHQGVGSLGLRINPPNSRAGQEDLNALAESRVQPAFILVPKFESADMLQAVVGACGERCPPLIPLVETTRGLVDLGYELDTRLPVAAVMFGGYDYSVDVGCEFAWEPLLFARSRLLTIARAHGLDAIDVPYIDLRNEAGLRAETERVRALGFTAKAAVHPAQVAAIQELFTPSVEKLAHARAVIEAAEASAGDAVQLDGQLIDAPVIDAARRMLARAPQSGGNG